MVPMSSVLLRTQLRHSAEALRFMVRKNFSRTSSESIFFYTLHKCASTLFSDYILRNLIGLRHVDYALDIYQGRLKPSGAASLNFAPYGRVYGPIRVSSLGAGNAIDQYLARPATSAEFVVDKIALFFVRDPRDILVSGYHSFAHTHGFSPVPEIRRSQEEQRARLLAQSVDEYALESADRQIRHFTTIHELAQVCRRSVILKYEDMIDHFDYFSSQLTQHIDIHPHVLRQIECRSRPRDRERQGSHRRSGRTGGFRHRLQPATIDALNHRLSGILENFNYPV